MSRADKIAEKLKSYNNPDEDKWMEKLGYTIGKALFALNLIATDPGIINKSALAKQTLDEIERVVDSD